MIEKIFLIVYNSVYEVAYQREKCDLNRTIVMCAVKYFFELYKNAASPEDFSVPLFCRSVGHRVANGHFRSRFTSHLFYEFIWTLEGGGVYELENGLKFDLKPGEFFIAPPDVMRVMYTKNDFWHYRWFSALDGMCDDIIEAFDLKYLTPFKCGSLESEFGELEEALKRYTPQNSCSAGALAYIILSKVACGNKAGASNKLADEVVELIGSNLSNPELNVDWLAEKINCSRSHLSRVFKSAVGESPSEFILKKRLLLAMKLLEDKELKIAQVANACGFSDSDYFSRFFKRRMGVVPREYSLLDYV